MPMPKGHHKQFCVHRHDTSITGRTKRGQCIACKNEQQRDYDSRHTTARKEYQKGRYKIYGKIYSQSVKGRFLAAKSVAKSRKLEWCIPFEEYEKLINQFCYYCEGKLNLQGAGLDRLDSSKGYLLNNVVSCCADCNWMKRDILTPEEMLAAVKAIKQVRLNKILNNNTSEVKLK